MSEIAQNLYRQWTLLLPRIHFVGTVFYPPHLAQILRKISSMIVLLINREFIWLVLAANIIAWPVSYLTMSAVLQNYAFRVSLAPWVFILAGFLALFLAAATISLYSLKAARTNPSEILRYE